jgi:hypothetical protein
MEETNLWYRIKKIFDKKMNEQIVIDLMDKEKMRELIKKRSIRQLQTLVG